MIYYTVNFCANSESDYGIVSYHCIGSLDQIIEGARVKSMQNVLLKYQQWIVKISKNGEFVCNRTMKNGEII